MMKWKLQKTDDTTDADVAQSLAVLDKVLSEFDDIQFEATSESANNSTDDGNVTTDESSEQLSNGEIKTKSSPDAPAVPPPPIDRSTKPRSEGTANPMASWKSSVSVYGAAQPSLNASGSLSGRSATMRSSTSAAELSTTGRPNLSSTHMSTTSIDARNGTARSTASTDAEAEMSMSANRGSSYPVVDNAPPALKDDSSRSMSVPLMKTSVQEGNGCTSLVRSRVNGLVRNFETEAEVHRRKATPPRTESLLRGSIETRGREAAGCSDPNNSRPRRARSETRFGDSVSARRAAPGRPIGPPPSIRPPPPPSTSIAAPATSRPAHLIVRQRRLSDGLTTKPDWSCQKMPSKPLSTPVLPPLPSKPMLRQTSSPHIDFIPPNSARRNRPCGKDAATHGPAISAPESKIKRLSLNFELQSVALRQMSGTAISPADSSKNSHERHLRRSYSSLSEAASTPDKVTSSNRSANVSSASPRSSGQKRSPPPPPTDLTAGTNTVNGGFISLDSILNSKVSPSLASNTAVESLVHRTKSSIPVLVTSFSKTTSTAVRQASSTVEAPSLPAKQNPPRGQSGSATYERRPPARRKKNRERSASQPAPPAPEQALQQIYMQLSRGGTPNSTLCSSASTVKSSTSASTNNGSTSTIINNGSTSASINNGSTSTSINNGSTSTSINNGSTSTSINNGSTSTSINNGSTSTSINNGSTSTSINNGSTSTSINNGSTSTSINNGSTSTSINNGSTSTSINNGSTPTSINNGSTSTSINNGSTSTRRISSRSNGNEEVEMRSTIATPFQRQASAPALQLTDSLRSGNSAARQSPSSIEGAGRGLRRLHPPPARGADSTTERVSEGGRQDGVRIGEVTFDLADGASRTFNFVTYAQSEQAASSGPVSLPPAVLADAAESAAPAVSAGARKMPLFSPIVKDRLNDNTNMYIPAPPSPRPDYYESELSETDSLTRHCSDGGGLFEVGSDPGDVRRTTDAAGAQSRFSPNLSPPMQRKNKVKESKERHQKAKKKEKLSNNEAAKGDNRPPSAMTQDKMPFIQQIDVTSITTPDSRLITNAKCSTAKKVSPSSESPVGFSTSLQAMIDDFHRRLPPPPAAALFDDANSSLAEESGSLENMVAPDDSYYSDDSLDGRDQRPGKSARRRRKRSDWATTTSFNFVHHKESRKRIPLTVRDEGISSLESHNSASDDNEAVRRRSLDLGLLVAQIDRSATSAPNTDRRASTSNGRGKFDSIRRLLKEGRLEGLTAPPPSFVPPPPPAGKDAQHPFNSPTYKQIQKVNSLSNGSFKLRFEQRHQLETRPRRSRSQSQLATSAVAAEISAGQLPAFQRNSCVPGRSPRRASDVRSQRSVTLLEDYRRPGGRRRPAPRPWDQEATARRAPRPSPRPAEGVRGDALTRLQPSTLLMTGRDSLSAGEGQHASLPPIMMDQLSECRSPTQHNLSLPDSNAQPQPHALSSHIIHTATTTQHKDADSRFKFSIFKGFWRRKQYSLEQM